MVLCRSPSVECLARKEGFLAAYVTSVSTTTGQYQTWTIRSELTVTQPNHGKSFRCPLFLLGPNGSHSWTSRITFAKFALWFLVPIFWKQAQHQLGPAQDVSARS